MEWISSAKFEEIKASGRLPSPKGVALQVVKLTKKDGVGSQEIAHIVKADPVLSGKLIKAANSLIAYQSRPIVSVVDAVGVLGLNMVRQLVLGFSIISESGAGVCQRFDYATFWTRSLLTAIAAQHLARQRSLGAAEEVFILGLLGQVGRLALATVYPEEYAQVLEKLGDSDDSELAAIELAQFGVDHRQMTQAMLADWGVPRALQVVVYHHENPEQAGFSDGGRDWRLAQVLHISESLAAVCVAPVRLRRKLVPQLMLSAARRGIETDMLADLGEGVLRDWREWEGVLSVGHLDIPPFKELLETAPLVPELLDMGAGQEVRSSHKLRILLVDDDRSVLLLLRSMLAGGGHVVETAQNGKDALGKMEEFAPQLVITDWIMPEMNGLDFCRAVRANENWRGVYLFIVTAQESTERLIEAFEAGVDDYLTKPINSKVLSARLRAGQRVIQLQEELEFDRSQLRQFAAELAASNDRLQHLALTDALTGLPNRRYVMDRLEQEWALSKRAGRSLTCMMIDVDHFKQVNDTYGHKVGDEALKQVVNTLRMSVRKQDVVARMGGEEFLVLCPDTLLEQAAQHAERIRKNVASVRMRSAGVEFFVTVSIGVASTADVDLHTVDMLVQLADRRLYSAKAAGRNRIVCA